MKLKLWVDQYVFYFGHKPLRMKSGLREPNVRFRFKLKDVRNYPAAPFIEQNTADSLVLAFMCCYEGDARTHVGLILDKIFALSLSPEALKEVLEDLDTLSNLRPVEGKAFRELMKERDIVYYPALKKTLLFQTGEQSGIN